jgi:Actin like proteins N terminal domain
MTSKNFQIVALDIGHSTLKLAYSDGSNLQTFERFPTAVALTPKGEYPQSDLVRIADFEYVVGDNAVQHLQSDRVPYVDNSFIGSRHYEVLIKGAVVRLKAKKIDRLIVSLPDGLYTEKKSQVTELIGDALDLGFGRVCEIGDLMLYKQGAACALAKTWFRKITIRGYRIQNYVDKSQARNEIFCGTISVARAWWQYPIAPDSQGYF